jgi:predicted solute-binding protein
LDLALDHRTLDRYLAMYANADTLDAPDDVRRAINTMYMRAFAAGALDREVRGEFAP